jgi:hypothetical protein
MTAIAEWFAAAVARTRKLDLADPRITFPAVWLSGVALAQIRILAVQQPWSRLTWAVVLLVPVAFCLGGWLASAIVSPRVAAAAAMPHEPSAGARRRIRLILSAFVVVGWLEEAHQWHAIHTIPLFASNIDAARAAQPGGPTIVLTDLLTVAAIFALVLPRKLFSRNAVPELALAVVALSGFALAGGRVTLMLPVAIALIARALYWGPPSFRLVVATGVIAVAVISGLFYLRESQHRTAPFERELYGDVLPETPVPLRPLLPLDIAIATNYAALARVVDYFPYEEPYGHGRYDALGVNLFVPSARNLGSVSARLNGPWITSTVAGPFWADGGLPAVALGTAAVGFLVLAAFMCARRTRALRYCVVGAHLYFLALFGLYTNLWTQEIDWVLDVPLLFLLGAVAEGGLREALVFREWRTDRRGGGRRRVLVAAPLVAALIVSTAIYEVLRTPGPPRVVPTSASSALAPVATFSLPAGLPRVYGKTRVLWSGDTDRLGKPAVLWLVEVRPRGVVVGRLAWPNGPIADEQSWRLPRAAAQGATFRVAQWRGRETLFFLRPTDPGVLISRISPTGDNHHLTTNFAPIPAARERGSVLAVGRWNGVLPDLIVISRPLRAPARLFVYSGETGFRRRIVDERLPYSSLGLRGSAVKLALARTSNTTIDLALLIRNGRLTGSGRAELHILEGRVPYRHLFDTPLQLPRALPPRYRLVVGSFAGSPALYVVDPARRSVSVFPFDLGRSSRSSAP